MSNTSYLRLSGLTKYYASMPVLKGVDLDVELGEFVTLLGPSGSGKTTLLMIVAGFLQSTEGSIILDGEEITKLPAFRRDIGMVFQNYSLFPHMSVFQNVAFPLRMRHVDPSEITAKVRKTLDLVKLSGMESRYPNELSGGQQQRVALARTLVFGPRLLLMDEPLGALDKQLRDHVQIEIKQIQRALGITVVSVTHDQTEALVMSDRIIVINGGLVEQTDSPGRLYEYPRTKFIARFIGECNFLTGIVKSVELETAVIAGAEGGPDIEAPRGSLQAGRPVDIAIRPERIFFRPLTENLANQASGVVTQITFLGDSTKYLITMDWGSMIVKTPNSGLASGPVLGERVTIGWDVGSVRLLEEGPARS